VAQIQQHMLETNNRRGSPVSRAPGVLFGTFYIRNLIRNINQSLRLLDSY